MKTLAVLTLLAVGVVPAIARAQAGSVQISILHPTLVTIRFGQSPVDFAVAPGLKFKFLATDKSVMITSASDRPMPYYVRFSAKNDICFAGGVQTGVQPRESTPIEPNQLGGIPACAKTH
jgi:hypothetical protein